MDGYYDENGVWHGDTYNYADDNTWLSQELNKEVEKHTSIVSPLSTVPSSTPSVTSRDEIINPYDRGVVNPYNYSTSTTGQVAYKHDLEKAKYDAEQQEARYQEWYNSPEQQVLRERQAGRNPDLTDLTGTEASDTQPSQGSPMDGAQTPIQEFLSVASGITSLVGSISSAASLASSFSTISLNNAHKHLLANQSSLVGEQLQTQQLSNIGFAESLFSKGIGNRLTNAISSAVSAGKSFDIDSWFKDDNNFSGLFESYGFNDNVVYRDAFARARENRRVLAQASYDANTGTLRSQKSFAESLADPYYDPDLLLQRSFLEPVMQSIEELNILRRDYDKLLLRLKDGYVSSLDPSVAASATNAKYQYESDYFNNFDGDTSAAYDMMLKKMDAIKRRAVSTIYDNQFNIYQKNKDNPVGMSSAYMILNGDHLKWSEFIAAYGVANLGFENDFYNDSDGNSVTNEGTVGWKMGRAHK